MALDTSSDGFEKVYESSGPENNGKYYEGYVEKKELFKWIRFWCVLKQQNIYFFKDVNTQIKENYFGFLPLEHPTNVEIIKSKEGKYEWSIKTKRGKITLRTQVATLRDGWITSMEKSLKHDPPSTQSYILHGSGPVSPTHQKASSNPSSPTRTPSQISSHRTASRKESLANYTITEEQVATLREFSNEIESMVELTDEELRIQDRLLKGDGWYQASYRREDVEKVLKNKANGVFIVRDYIDFKTSKNLGYVISLKDETSQMRHHRIQKVQDSFVIKGYEGRCFDTLHNLLRFFILSQRKKLTLVPFDPKQQSQSQQIPQAVSGYEKMAQSQQIPQAVSGYEKMDAWPPPMNGSVERKPRSISLHDRRLPPVPPDPSQSKARSRTIHNHQHHSPPYLQDTQQPPKGSYVEMKSPFKDRSLPPVPQLQQNVSPQSLSSTADSSYLNMPEPTPPVNHYSYQNIESSPYENTRGAAEVEDEPPPPVLPPRNPQSFRDPARRYVNLPPGGGIPGRNPLRKANTFS